LETEVFKKGREKVAEFKRRKIKEGEKIKRINNYDMFEL